MTMQVPPAVWTWARRIGYVMVVLLAAFGIYSFVERAAGPPAAVLNRQTNVAVAWNETVSRLGIEPLYPPQEDVYVGDIFATATRRDLPFVGRSIKLRHINLLDKVIEGYGAVPVFPNTQARPTGEGQAWEQASSTDLFVPGARKTLPLVAFPGFSVTSSRQAQGGLSAQSSWFGGLFGTSRDNEEVEELQFPGSETYGVDAVEGTAALLNFCKDPNNSLCTETGVRRMLSNEVGEDVWKTTQDPTTGKQRYVMGVELILIDRIYLTRSITQIHSSDSTRGEIASVVAKLNELSAAPPSGGSANAPAPTPDGGASRQAQFDALRQRLQTLVEQIGGPGASVGAFSANGSKISLNQVYPRPLVFGFRSVHLVPRPDPTPASGQGGQAGSTTK